MSYQEQFFRLAIWVFYGLIGVLAISLLIQGVLAVMGMRKVAKIKRDVEKYGCDIHGNIKKESEDKE